METTTPQAALALRNILVASDFSQTSENALMHAVSVAHLFGASLHFAYVVEPAMFAMVPPDAYMGTMQAEEYAIKLAQADAEKKVAEALRLTHCEDIDKHISVSLGTVGDTLRSIILREQIDLAIVGTHGRTGLRKLVMGSTAENVFCNATCPVLTIGPHSWLADPGRVQIQRILFPTDLSTESTRALHITCAIASKMGAKLTMMHVVERFDADAALDRARVVSVLEQRMREMAAATGLAPGMIDFQVVFGRVGDSVLQIASESDADLIAFGLKAPNTHDDRVPWKHAYKVVCEAGCPVLSLRGNGER